MPRHVISTHTSAPLFNFKKINRNKIRDVLYTVQTQISFLQTNDWNKWLVRHTIKIYIRALTVENGAHVKVVKSESESDYDVSVAVQSPSEVKLAEDSF